MSAVNTASAQRGRIGRIAAGTGTAIAVAALTAGCAAGQVAQTADERTSLDGTNAKVGTMDLRAVAITAPPSLSTTYPTGGAALLNAVFVNNGRSADRLVDIRTSAARAWGAYSSPASAFTLVVAANGLSSTPAPSTSSSASVTAPSAGSVPTGSETNSPSGSSSASGTASASNSPSSGSTSAPPSSSTPSSSTPSSSTPSSSTSATTQPKGIQSVTIPAGGRVGFGTPEATGALVLSGITRTLRPAQTVTISFTFARAGTVSVPVTVQVADLGRTASVPAAGAGGD